MGCGWGSCWKEEREMDREVGDEVEKGYAHRSDRGERFGRGCWRREERRQDEVGSEGCVGERAMGGGSLENEKRGEWLGRERRRFGTGERSLKSSRLVAWEEERWHQNVKSQNGQAAIRWRGGNFFGCLQVEQKIRRARYREKERRWMRSGARLEGGRLEWSGGGQDLDWSGGNQDLDWKVEKSRTETKVRRWIEGERRGTEKEERHRMRRDVLEQSVTIKFSEK